MRLLHGPPLPPADPGDAARAFAGPPFCRLQQAWRERPEAGFRPGRVYLGGRETTLWTYAVLQDNDIFNAATGPNQRAWETGDLFEMFVRPTTGDAYWELHVTPEDQQTRLRWPGPDTVLDARQTGLVPYLVEQNVLQSWTWVSPEKRQWHVLAAISGAHVTDAGGIEAGDEWLFSFSRYDAARGSTGPAEQILSSTSASPRPKFPGAAPAVPPAAGLAALAL
jgi:hypothetical protein